MKNRLLQITRSGIPYIKELRPRVKTVTSALVMQQLDYWFERFPDGFWKFLEPPQTDHDQYKEGDSWQEELGFSKAEFRTAFANIGVAYKSKTDYQDAADKFIFIDIDEETGTEKGREEKFYCSYFDRKTGLTHYFRNHNLVDSFLDSLIKTTENNGGSKPTVLISRNQDPSLLEINGLDLQKSTKLISRSEESSFLEINKVHIIEDPEITTEITTEKKNKKGEQPTAVAPVKPASPSPSSLPKDKKETDPRIHHPAIKAVRAIIQRYPLKLVWDDLIKVIGDDPDLERLNKCATAWAKKSTNIGNIDVWVFDWYVNGIPAGNNVQGRLKRNDGSRGAGKNWKPGRTDEA